MKKYLFILSILLLGTYQMATAVTCHYYYEVTTEVTEDCTLRITITSHADFASCDGWVFKVKQTIDGNPEEMGSGAATYGNPYVIELSPTQGETSITYSVYGRAPYSVLYDLFASGTVDMSHCCRCPVDADSWLTIDIMDIPGYCACLAIPRINIPPDITCFKHYRILNDEVDNDFSPPFEVGEAYPMPYCIPLGQSVTFYAVFLINPDDDPWSGDACFVEITAECPDGTHGKIGSEEQIFIKSKTSYYWSNETFNLSFVSETEGLATLELFDIAGNKVASKQSEIQVGREELQVSTDQLESGTYFYALVINGEKYSSNKFIIIR